MTDIKRHILEYVRSRGPVKTYAIAKHFKLTYGTAQYYVYLLERERLVKVAKLLSATYVYVDGQDPMEAVTVRDLLTYLAKTLKRHKGKRP